MWCNLQQFYHNNSFAAFLPKMSTVAGGLNGSEGGRDGA